MVKPGFIESILHYCNNENQITQVMRLDGKTWFYGIGPGNMTM